MKQEKRQLIRSKVGLMAEGKDESIAQCYSYLIAPPFTSTYGLFQRQSKKERKKAFSAGAKISREKKERKKVAFTSR